MNDLKLFDDWYCLSSSGLVVTKPDDLSPENLGTMFENRWHLDTYIEQAHARVSTIFIVIDHDFSNRRKQPHLPPLVFETCLFCDLPDLNTSTRPSEVQNRYRDILTAITSHWELVRQIEESLDPWRTALRLCSVDTNNLDQEIETHKRLDARLTEAASKISDEN